MICDTFIDWMIDNEVLFADMLLIAGYSWGDIDDAIEKDSDIRKQEIETDIYANNLNRETQRNIAELTISIDSEWIKERQLAYINEKIEVAESELNNKYKKYREDVKFKTFKERQGFNSSIQIGNIKSLHNKRFNADKYDSDRITQIDIDIAHNKGFGDVLTINQAGFCLCPFHGENTPSFKVYDNLRGKCFGGCGWAGDRIDYEMKKYGLNFVEAVRRLK